MAISFRRLAARVSSRFEILAQAISSTRPTTPMARAVAFRNTLCDLNAPQLPSAACRSWVLRSERKMPSFS